jgi:hypothetical protein
MSELRTFALGGMEFEVAACTDPSAGAVTLWVYRTDIHPKVRVATGTPSSLQLIGDYREWDVAVIEQAVADRLEDAPA